MQTAETNYHIPVLRKESIDGLVLNQSGIYVDCTFGGGGHSSEILNRLTDGKLYAFDRDNETMANRIADSRFTMIQHDFRWVKHFLDYYGALPIDGLLADLGLSSRHLDNADRGFSFKNSEELDMRMDQDMDQDATHILNHYEEIQLQKILGEYGEIKNARSLAMSIVNARKLRPFKSASDLIKLLDQNLHFNDKRNKYLSQVFQALRIEVNDELTSLELLLNQCAEIIKPNGRLVIISYHSLEDRLVKNYLASGNVQGNVESDFFGQIKKPFTAITRKPIEPSSAEIEKNPRSRSAKMRIGTRN